MSSVDRIQLEAAGSCKNPSDGEYEGDKKDFDGAAGDSEQIGVAACVSFFLSRDLIIFCD